MIKRDDLVKQFDIIVRQEIINHNQAIYDSNQSINDIRNEVRKIHSESKVVHASLGSTITKLNSNLLELTSSLSKFTQAFSSCVNDLKAESSDLDIRLIEACKNDENLVSIYESLIQRNGDLDSRLAQLDKKLEDFTFFVRMSLYDLKLDLLKEVDKKIQDIVNRPSEALAVKDQLDEKIKIAMVDFEGLMREIRVQKKECFILEKKIENIYMLLGKTKDGGLLVKPESST